VTYPLAYYFLEQVVEVAGAHVALLLGLLYGLYALAAAVLARGIGSDIAELEAELERGGDVSSAMSVCLQETQRFAAWALAAHTVLFTLFATLFFMRSLLGASYALVAALIANFPALAWMYAAGKQLLINSVPPSTNLHYVGTPLSLGKKLAIIFIGCYIVASAALVQLVSSKVTAGLEELAIASSMERFTRVYDSANLLHTVDEKGLSTLREYIPAGFTLHKIDPANTEKSRSQDGTIEEGDPVTIDSVSASGQRDPLTSDEKRAIARIRNGNSLAFISPHVSVFRELRDGSIIALAIPFTPYIGIPYQIAFFTLVIAALTTIIFSIATYFLARDVTHPLRQLQTIASEMAQGNFETSSRVFADDEVGQLALSFAETRANLRRLLGRVGGSGATITDGVRVITGGTDTLLLRSREQASLTENSSIALENVRGGINNVLGAADTVTELTQDASSRALELQASAEEVARSMDILFQSVEKTSSSTTEMNASAKEMSSRTDVLAGIGDEVLSFVAQMGSTVEELRQNASSTADISRQVREDAEAGGAAVNKTVEGIHASQELTGRTAEVLDELQQSIGEISQILNVIEEVTNRTNLLALNAAIIAAQAGEHGLGFTVVADEIRELAERTRGSTKEIGGIIKAVQAGSKQAVAKMHESVDLVKKNVGLAQDASTSLSKIVGSASQSYDMATKIANALDEQSRASQHLHEVTSRMSDHISEINRSTREQARGTQLLAQESERVREIAAQVRNATDEQSQAGRGITLALEKISEDARAMRDLLERQLQETDEIANASRMMLDIAQENDNIARDFTSAVANLVRSGQDFESEVARFRTTADA
jgi:methyl-accepting chemotaxis protein